jgi:AbrB family looped-hinge helix DNA binding protein
MATATVTSKGQITIPQPIRERLRLKPGDRVDFVVAENGRVELQTRKIPFEQLRGMLKSPFKRPVSIREMDRGIARAVRERFERVQRQLRDERRCHQHPPSVHRGRRP